MFFLSINVVDSVQVKLSISSLLALFFFPWPFSRTALRPRPTPTVSPSRVRVIVFTALRESPLAVVRSLRWCVHFEIVTYFSRFVLTAIRRRRLPWPINMQTQRSGEYARLLPRRPVAWDIYFAILHFLLYHYSLRTYSYLFPYVRPRLCLALRCQCVVDDRAFYTTGPVENVVFTYKPMQLFLLNALAVNLTYITSCCMNIIIYGYLVPSC